MSTERRGSDLIRSWLDESYEAEREPRDYLDHLLDEVPETPQQRRRWWTVPLFRREAQTPTATPSATSEYQPNPIPASNGHTPTVIGRTQSMLSPVKAITAGALIFAVGGAFLIAQPFGQQDAVAPGAETDDADMAPSFFSGTVGGPSSWVELAEGVYERRDDGVVLGGGGGNSFPLDSDDPRFSGRASITGNEADYREGATTLADSGLDGIVLTGFMRLVNDGGAWEGDYQALAIDGLDFENWAGWLTGSGDYEGLSAYFVLDFPDQGLVGHITAEGPPPAPEGLPE